MKNTPEVIHLTIINKEKQQIIIIEELEPENVWYFCLKKYC